MAPRANSTMKGHRWFAATYDFLTQWAERRVLGQLRQLVAGGATGRVLDLGVGTGANFPYYASAEAIIAIDPDPFMLERARKRAHKLGCNVALYQATAEALPFADAFFDTVVSTLVLCTVADPDRSLAEVRRVLKPSGTFRFIEHVRADGVLGRLQDALTPAWSWIGAGCHPNQRTAERIAAAGFEMVHMQQQPMGPTPLIVGVARPG